MTVEVRANYDYASTHEDDLVFCAGQVITVIEEVDKEWYSGEFADPDGHLHQGMFPRNFVTIIEPQTIQAPDPEAMIKEEGTEAATAPPSSTQPNVGPVGKPLVESSPRLSYTETLSQRVHDSTQVTVRSAVLND